VDGAAGDDDIRVDNTSLPATILGGGGDDVIDIAGSGSAVPTVDGGDG